MFSPSLETTHTPSKICAHSTSIEMKPSEKIWFFPNARPYCSYVPRTRYCVTHTSFFFYGFVPILLQFHQKVIGGRLFRKEKERNKKKERERERKKVKKKNKVVSRRASISSSAVSFFMGICFGRLAVAVVLFLRFFSFALVGSSFGRGGFVLGFSCLGASFSGHSSKLNINNILERCGKCHKKCDVGVVACRV